ncbi:hypothetical protein SAMN05216480_107148 [Pustulibacterium marinum]|uniref:Uncharacterized protein n=1 Tax=Pustulibacterium marinum TaxID=1224947 RepID=A0A1I7H707_9FLAO|nr:hypothetical protein [Pustulibacterium marinum]SFU56483.1 hypothetical protein SAMN05216480_107148 [Pustulibacterium marinum]
MNHPFYQKNKKEQLKFQLTIASIALLCVAVGFLLAWLLSFWLLAFVIFVIVITLLAPFIDTPSMVKQGRLTYHSLFFLSETPKNGVIQIHGGTLFDYYFAIPKDIPKSSRKRFILQQYLEGLLQLIATYEVQPDSDIIIRGTSYIINTKTAEKLGFQLKNTEGLQQLILIFNYAQITCANSLANGKLTFPKVSKTKTFEASIQDLIARKERIKELSERLKG